MKAFIWFFTIFAVWGALMVAADWLDCHHNIFNKQASCWLFKPLTFPQ